MAQPSVARDPQSVCRAVSCICRCLHSATIDEYSAGSGLTLETVYLTALSREGKPHSWIAPGW